MPRKASTKAGKATSHYSAKFTRAWKKVEKLMEAGDEQGARECFRNEMLALGHVERVRNLYRISNKLSNSAEFFVPNWAQDKFLKEKSGRDVVLKCRQVGYTTLSGVRGLDYALWEPNSKCGILAHLQITVTTIFNDIVKYTYAHFLRDWGDLYRPTEKSASRTELAFADDGLGRPLDSSMRVLYDFRGKTVNFLHISEASRVEDDRLLGSLQGVPVNGQVIYESTPNGRGGDFYRQWQNWRSMGTLAPYRGFFIPWYLFYPEQPEKFSLPPGTELTPYEKSLMENPEIKEHHIAWRRWCITANCQGDPDFFDNEYCTDDVNCFFTGEALVFPSSLIKSQAKNTRPPSKTGFLVQDNGKLDVHMDEKGCVAIWEEPDPMCTYAIGADPAGGVGKDRGAAYVICQQSGKIVARLWGQLDPADFANELIKLGTYYNKAYVCVEANNHGHVVIHILTTKGYRNLYKRYEIDAMSNKRLAKVGFLTTNESKLTLTEKFKTALRTLTIFDNDLINEMTTFVQIASKTGRSIRREASHGSHDDLVMAACLAQEMNATRTISTQREVLSSAPTEESPLDPETGALAS